MRGLWGPKDPRDVGAATVENTFGIRFVVTELMALDCLHVPAAADGAKGRECVGRMSSYVKRKRLLSVFFAVIFSDYSVLVLKMNDSLTNKEAVVCEVDCCPYLRTFRLCPGMGHF